MYRDDLKDFLLKVHNHRIRRDEWKEDVYFIPNGTWTYDAMSSMVMMEGVTYTPDTGKFFQDLPILKGFETYEYVNTCAGVLSDDLVARYPAKHILTIAKDKGAQCRKCKGHNVRQTESGFQTTTTIMWCDTCKDEA